MRHNIGPSIVAIEEKTLTDIVIADSHPEMLTGVRFLLENRFGSVVMVSDVRSLMNALDKIQPELLIVDLSLPAVDRVNTVTEVRRCHPDLRIIVLSVYDEQEVANEMISAGVAGFVPKRAAATELIPAVEAVLAGKVYVSHDRLTRENWLS